MSKKLFDAKTVEQYPLVVGSSRVPYLLGDLPNVGKQIIGEVWEVDDVTLQNLDEYPMYYFCTHIFMIMTVQIYEGIGKGYFSRRKIPVTSKNGDKVEAFAYFKTESASSPELRNSPHLDEYTLEFHKTHYNAIMHIMVKQQLYLGDLTWGNFNT